MRVPTGLNRLQALVAGQVLEQLKDNPGVGEIVVDGVPIADPAAAIALYERSRRDSAVFAPLDRLADKIAGNKDDGLTDEERAFAERLRPLSRAKGALKRASHAVSRALGLDKLKKPFDRVSGFDAQPVRYTADVEIRMRSGVSVKIREELVDVRSTLTLKRLGLLAESTALNPIPVMAPVGPALLGVTELTAAAVVGSLAGLAALGIVPKRQTTGAPFAGALARAGVKQLAVAAVGWIPGVSEVAVPTALYADARAISELRKKTG